MDSPETILARLFARTSKGIQLGCGRMREAVGRLGNPHQFYHSVHVAGTNGKGSVCAYIDSALRACGFRTALFTSPHILRFEERFIINGSMARLQDWLDVYAAIENIIEDMGLTFFEATTLIAFELFRRQGVQWAVFEVGLGGRLDATNIITPDVAVIATIGVDHTEYLGSDIVSIAREKLGIVKEKVPMVIADPDNPLVLEEARKACGRLHAPLTVARRNEISDIDRSGLSTQFTYAGRRYTIPLQGSYQPLNALCAIKALEILRDCPQAGVAEGLANVRIPGRFQIVRIGQKTCVFDVGHNVQAFEGLVQSLAGNFPLKGICFVTGIMKDKDFSGMLNLVAKAAQAIIVTQPATDRACAAHTLAQYIPPSFCGDVLVVEDVGMAVETAFARAEEIICIAGSFYTVGEAMRRLGVMPYPEKHNIGR